MVFVIANPWLPQKSNNKAPFRFRSGRPFLPVTPFQVSPSLPHEHWSPQHNYGDPRWCSFKDPTQGLEDGHILLIIVWHTGTNNSQGFLASTILMILSLKPDFLITVNNFHLTESKAFSGSKLVRLACNLFWVIYPICMDLTLAWVWHN